MKKLAQVLNFAPRRNDVALLVAVAAADADATAAHSQRRLRLVCRWSLDHASGTLSCAWFSDEAQDNCDQSRPIRIAA